jgi:SOS response regulatory protein OraA/RecX
VKIEREEKRTVKRVNMMLIEFLDQREVSVQDLHDQLREEGHRHTIEYLCRSILGARDLDTRLLGDILRVLDASYEEIHELCHEHFMGAHRRS